MRDLLLLVIVVGLVPLILFRPWVGILAWFWIGLMAPHRLTWAYMQDFQIAALIGAVTLVALFFARDRRPLPYTREMIMMFVFAGYMAMTSHFAMNPTGAWAQWQHVMKILLMTFLTPMLIYGDRRIILLLLVITFSIAFFGFKGGLFAISTGGNYMVLGPSRSFLQGNTYVGMAMIMVLPLILVSARMFSNRWVDLGWPLIQQWSKPIGLAMYGVFWLTVIAILATYSRGALLGLIVVAPFLLVRMRHKGLMATLALIAITVVGVSAPERLMERWQTIQNYEEDDSAMQRIQSWGVNFNMAKERPLVGMGFRNPALGYHWWVSYANFEGRWRHVLSPHSIYFQVMGQHGFGGLAVYLLLIGFTFLTLGRIRRTARKQTGQIWLAEYAWAIQVGLIGFLAAGAFLDVAYFNLLYAFIALAIIMRRELEEAPPLSASAAELASSRLATGPRFPDFVATSTPPNASKLR